MKTPLEEWIDRLAREAATVEIVACFYAPGTPHNGCLIGITGDGSAMPFWGCRTQGEVGADLQERRVRYAAKYLLHNNQPHHP